MNNWEDHDRAEYLRKYEARMRQERFKDLREWVESRVGNNNSVGYMNGYEDAMKDVLDFIDKG